MAGVWGASTIFDNIWGIVRWWNITFFGGVKSVHDGAVVKIRW